MGLGEAPPRGSAAELFSFGAQLQAALRGLVLTQVYMPTPFERVLKLAFAQRPGEAPSMQLVYECMARYSNLLLVGPDDTVLCAAHQVGTKPACSAHVQLGAAALLDGLINSVLPLPAIQLRSSILACLPACLPACAAGGATHVVHASGAGGGQVGAAATSRGVGP